MKRILVFSTKRSTHHAFLESFLSGKLYHYDNDCYFSHSKCVVGKSIKSNNEMTQRNDQENSSASASNGSKTS